MGTRARLTEAERGLRWAMWMIGPFMKKAVIPMPRVTGPAAGDTGANSSPAAAASARITCQPYQGPGRYSSDWA